MGDDCRGRGEGRLPQRVQRRCRWQTLRLSFAKAPYEILLGGLASCIAVTLRLYADHKGITLAGVDVKLEFDRVHADDCVDCDERADGWIERIQSNVTIRGSFNDAQRVRLEQVAQRCPVHKTLSNGVHIVDTVAFERSTEQRS